MPTCTKCRRGHVPPREWSKGRRRCYACKGRQKPAPRAVDPTPAEIEAARRTIPLRIAPVPEPVAVKVLSPAVEMCLRILSDYERERWWR